MIRFNRYMVECEFYISGFEFRCTYVLIDTWWNVNVFAAYAGEWDDGVLIDTWWNVNNFSTVSTVVLYRRFNRYMVECESGLY